MDKISCNLTNCYGIQSFQHEFDFSDTNAICVYARNGLMKTSFSKTLKKIQDRKTNEIKDEIFDLAGIADIKVDGNTIRPENIFVIKSFESFLSAPNCKTLRILVKINVMD